MTIQRVKGRKIIFLLALSMKQSFIINENIGLLNAQQCRLGEKEIIDDSPSYFDCDNRLDFGQLQNLRNNMNKGFGDSGALHHEIMVMLSYHINSSPFESNGKIFPTTSNFETSSFRSN